MKKIITISRQFGSGGRTIGKEVAERLGIPCYDQELIQKISEETGLDGDYIKENGEYTVYRGWFANAFLARDERGLSTQDYIWLAQLQIIQQLADKESCVIVGRCADYILRDRPNVLKTFIHADTAWRADRIVRVYGETDETPEKRLKDKDERRKAYYQRYTDMEMGEAVNYHISLDSGVIGLDKCVDIICDLYNNMDDE
ncbi:MAG: cytidylate kinase-like family protein [Solobacterium sp.]|nr:cytidylate kinase-like family protein [Solobacterium sp.]